MSHFNEIDMRAGNTPPQAKTAFETKPMVLFLNENGAIVSKDSEDRTLRIIGWPLVNKSWSMGLIKAGLSHDWVLKAGLSTNEMVDEVASFVTRHAKIPTVYPANVRILFRRKIELALKMDVMLPQPFRAVPTP